MIIHLSIIFIILIISFFYEHSFRVNKIKTLSESGVASDYKGSIIPWIIVFGYLAFLAGMRTKALNDTAAYVFGFRDIIPSWDYVKSILAGDYKDKGFYVLATLFKMFVSTDYHAWFLFVASVESILLVYILRRESVSFFDTCFYLFASTLYYNYFSMMRQWLAICIVFFAIVKFLPKKQYVQFILLCILAAQFHTSAYLVIVIALFLCGEPWSKKQIALIMLAAVGFVFAEPLLSFMGSASEENTYGYVIDTMQSGSGSSWLRIPFEMLPLIVAFIYRKSIKRYPLMNICINASLITVLLTVLASFTSGIYIFRMTTYFRMFNLILIPFLLNVVIKEEQKSIYRIGYYTVFSGFFIFQMNYSNMWPYGSNILGNFM